MVNKHLPISVQGIFSRRSAVRKLRANTAITQNRHASIQKSLSKGKSVGVSCLRFSTASC